MMDDNDDQCVTLKAEIIKLLEEIGSVELMAALLMEELFAQTPQMHNPENPISENALVSYALGLFLSHNNINAGEPHPYQVNALKSLLADYIDEFTNPISAAGIKRYPGDNTTTTMSRLWKILDDVNAHAYLEQKEEYCKEIFLPLNQHFSSRYNFTIDFAMKFTSDLIIKIQNYLEKQIESYRSFYEKNAHYKEDSDYIEFCKKHNTTPNEQFKVMFNHHFFHNTTRLFLINTSDNDFGYSPQDNKMLKNFLNASSCTFGDQFDKFDDFFSDNIISVKPIIKLSDDVFFVAKPDFLQYRLDVVLGYLLSHEKDTSDIQIRFRHLKAKYVENMLYKIFSRIFPQSCIFRNLYYWIGEKRMEVDMLIKYDNKIFVIEAKSGDIPVYAKIRGGLTLEKRLDDIIDMANDRCSKVENYIKSNPNAIFWADARKKNIAVTIEPISSGYEFILIGASLQSLANTIFNLKHNDHKNNATFNKRFFEFYLYDLDIMTDLLEAPYFIHFIQRRLEIRNKNDTIIHCSDFDFLSMYMNNRPINTPNLNPNKPNIQIVLPDTESQIDGYYTHRNEKPSIDIPENLKLMITALQKSYKPGFTKITSAILDLPSNYQNKLSDKIKTSCNELINLGDIKIFSILLEPVNIKIEFRIQKVIDGFEIACREL